MRPTDWPAPLPARGMPDVEPSVEVEAVWCVDKFVVAVEAVWCVDKFVVAVEAVWCVDKFVVAVELCYLSTQPRTKARTVSPTGGPNI